MEFRLDEAQIELQQTVGRFCADRFPLDAIATREATRVDRVAWLEMAQLGFFGLLVPVDAGGNGLGVVDSALVFEVLGSHLVPGPLLWTLLAAAMVDGASTGELLVGGVDASCIDGGTAVVEHGGDIDVLLVLGNDGVLAHPVAELGPPARLEPLDPLTPVARLTGIDNGSHVGGPEVAAELRRLGTVLSAAVLAGVGARALEVARAYALERHQFGAPIGSFQAVKHLLADMYVRSTLAQSAVYAAAARLDDPGGEEMGHAAAGAKLLAADAAIANASTAVQVLGGMGFTWHMLPNYLLKRAWALDAGFGAADDHACDLGSTLAAAAR
jgi:alkylation response protein AidB-like acyl-CoA dehydrogenase